MSLFLDRGGEPLPVPPGAGGYLQHSRNGALADLRTRVPLRRGADDWELRVSVVPRAEQGWLLVDALPSSAWCAPRAWGCIQMPFIEA